MEDFSNYWFVVYTMKTNIIAVQGGQQVTCLIQSTLKVSENTEFTRIEVYTVSVFILEPMS